MNECIVITGFFSKKITNCQQNKHGLNRQEMYPPLFLISRFYSAILVCELQNEAGRTCFHLKCCLTKVLSEIPRKYG